MIGGYQKDPKKINIKVAKYLTSPPILIQFEDLSEQLSVEHSES